MIYFVGQDVLGQLDEVIDVHGGVDEVNEAVLVAVLPHVRPPLHAGFPSAFLFDRLREIPPAHAQQAKAAKKRNVQKQTN